MLLIQLIRGSFTFCGRNNNSVNLAHLDTATRAANLAAGTEREPSLARSGHTRAGMPKSVRPAQTFLRAASPDSESRTRAPGTTSVRRVWATLLLGASCILTTRGA